MEGDLQKSFVTGVERMIARAELLDSINVFPVADGDTGRNLSISLIPLRDAGQDKKEGISHQLLVSARGNSGNIASQFFSALCHAETISHLTNYAQEGRTKAWQAVLNPRPGTMLSVFDALIEVLPQEINPDRQTVEKIIAHLEKAVHQTCDQLPRLKEAGVVDAGALGMYIFFEGFFSTLGNVPEACRPVTETFKNRLKISSSFQEQTESGYCVDFVVQSSQHSPVDLKTITNAQEEVIIIPEGDFYKIHLHTRDREMVRSQMNSLGNVVNWEDDNLASQIEAFKHVNLNPLHIMTDAAGSLTTEDAKKYGFTLLNSYLTVGDKCLPETYFHPEELYDAMNRGIKVSTSQASVYERHQFYESALERFEKVLYLCVGSVFTGNYQGAQQWKSEHDKNDKFFIIDTGAASGRLGIIALATARHLVETNNMEKTFAFAKKAISACEEYVFLDKLQYLAAGGRLSKTGAFFGDIFNMKPVISPQPEGARKVGVVRNQEEQVRTALEKLAAALSRNSQALIMLEYSDNKIWVENVMQQIIAERYPKAEIILHPLSLTSGAHMGPGTWAVAFLPEQTTPLKTSLK